MEYVVKSERLRDNLYSLGFNYRTVKDKTEQQENIWLFKKSEMLLNAITFYTNNKRKMIELKQVK